MNSHIFSIFEVTLQSWTYSLRSRPSFYPQYSSLNFSYGIVLSHSNPCVCVCVCVCVYMSGRWTKTDGCRKTDSSIHANLGVEVVFNWNLLSWNSLRFRNSYIFYWPNLPNYFVLFLYVLFQTNCTRKSIT